MLRLNKKMKKFEKAFNVEPERFYIIFNGRLTDIFLNQFCIFKEKPTIEQVGPYHTDLCYGPYNTIEEARAAILAYYSEYFPETYVEALTHYSLEDLIRDGFTMGSWTSYRIISNSAMAERMQERNNFYKLSAAKQEEIREQDALEICIREQREAQRIKSKPVQERSRREQLFLQNLALEEEHAIVMSKEDPFYKKVLERLAKARAHINQEQQKEVTK